MNIMSIIMPMIPPHVSPVVWSREYGHTLSSMSHLIAFILDLVTANDEVCTTQQSHRGYVIATTLELLYRIPVPSV